MKQTAVTDASTLVSKADLDSLKTKVDDIDVDTRMSVPANLSKVSNVVNNDVVQKIVYNQLVTKFNAIDTKIQSTIGLLLGVI